MGKVTVATVIDAPPEDAWAVLADIGAISRWNPGVSASHSTSEAPRGEGATRHCDVQTPGGRGIGYLEERVFDWREGEGFRIGITDTNMPLKQSVVSFAIAPDGGGGTRVAVSPEYTLRGGPLGRLADALFARKRYEQGMRALLAGLKHHVEAGEEVGSRVPEPAG